MTLDKSDALERLESEAESLPEDALIAMSAIDECDDLVP